MNVNAGTLIFQTVSLMPYFLQNFQFSPNFPMTAQALVVLLSFALPSAYPLRAPTCQHSIGLTPSACCPRRQRRSPAPWGGRADTSIVP